MQDRVGHLERERDALHQSLVTSQEELTGLKNVREEEREHLERTRKLGKEPCRERVEISEVAVALKKKIEQLEGERDALHKQSVTSQEEWTGLKKVREEEREHLERTRIRLEEQGRE